ncbi:MAG: DUF2318 domain-containing protein [Synergistaceae bacterium]|jgi:uncharacterized membrane protein|nr:DUF2318 domain-containing protein [Synergistaceae bacterium]
MLEYIIKVTINSLYLVIPLSMLYAFLNRANRFEAGKTLYRGLAPGFIPALVYAVVKRNTAFGVREYYDLGVFVPMLVCGLALLWSLCRVAGSVRAPLQQKEMTATDGPGRKALYRLTFCFAALVSAALFPNILLYPFEFAVGMDNIFNTEFLFKVIGYSAGLLLAALAGFAIYKAASGAGGRLLFAAASVSLLVLDVKTALTIVQILLGRNMIPRYRLLTRSVIWTLTHVNFFLYAMIAIAAATAALQYIRVKSARPSGENPALVRRARHAARKQIRVCVTAVLAVAISLLSVTVGATYSNRRVELSPPIEFPAQGDRIVIPLEMVNDGNLHRFSHKVLSLSQMTDVRYIVIKKNDTAYGVGLDACDVCGPTGYYERKGQVVCILCDVVMNKATIGLPGGCNPVPLKFEIAEGNLIIMTQDLADEARRF